MIQLQTEILADDVILQKKPLLILPASYLCTWTWARDWERNRYMVASVSKYVFGRCGCNTLLMTPPPRITKPPHHEVKTPGSGRGTTLELLCPASQMLFSFSRQW